MKPYTSPLFLSAPLAVFEQVAAEHYKTAAQRWKQMSDDNKRDKAPVEQGPVDPIFEALDDPMMRQAFIERMDYLGRKLHAETTRADELSTQLQAHAPESSRLLEVHRLVYEGCSSDCLETVEAGEHARSCPVCALVVVEERAESAEADLASMRLRQVQLDNENQRLRSRVDRIRLELRRLREDPAAVESEIGRGKPKPALRAEGEHDILVWADALVDGQYATIDLGRTEESLTKLVNGYGEEVRKAERMLRSLRGRLDDPETSIDFEASSWVKDITDYLDDGYVPIDDREPS